MLQPHLFKRIARFFAAGTLLLTACDPKENATPAGKYENGVLIVNEGPFQNGTGTISYFNRTAKSVEDDIFQTVNGRPLGNVVQSVSIHNGRAYIVVNNAGKIEVADAKDFTSVGVITGLVMPRYFLGINEQKAYVTQWGTGGVNGSVLVVDLQTNAVTKTIPTGRGPERLLNVAGTVYVVCGGGFGEDNRVTVINANTDEVITDITVGENPNNIQLDDGGRVWVSCGGKKVFGNPAQNTAGSLVRISTPVSLAMPSNRVELTLPFADVNGTPAEMTINKAKNTLFYTFAGKVYRQDVNTPTLNTTPVINRSFYELGIDPADDVLYAADAGDYNSNGKAIRYNPATGSSIDSVQVGIIPGGFTFR
jgi:YVTN family beta-propeller protein